VTATAVFAVLVASAPVWAQESPVVPVPVVEVSAGYTFMRDVSDDLPEHVNFPVGWYGSTTVNLTTWFGLVGEGTGSYKNNFGGNVPYLQFFPAIFGAAWFGGLGPGLLVTTLSALAAMYFFLPPAGLAVEGSPEVMSLGFFIAIGTGISWLNHQLGSAAVLSTGRAERLDAIINTTADGIIVIGTDGRIESFNRGAERLFGYPESEVLGRNVSLLMPSPYHEEHDHYLQRYLATGRGNIIGTGREVQGLRKDGTTFPLHLSVGEITVHGERKFTGIVHDLSSRVQMEGQLREQASLAKLGEMAAVIAHEVKNPLAGIRGAIQVLRSSRPSSRRNPAEPAWVCRPRSG
jgi:two-component system sensor kinase FixL